MTPAQLRALGIGLEEQRHRVERGEWCDVEPGLIGLRGVAASWHRTMTAATLGAPHAAITAGTALRLHGTDGFDDYEERYAVAAKGRRVHLPAGFVVRESRRLRTTSWSGVVANLHAAVRRQRILRAGR